MAVTIRSGSQVADTHMYRKKPGKCRKTKISSFLEGRIVPKYILRKRTWYGASLPPTNEARGKVMFYTCLSVILFMGEGSASGGLHPGGPITMGYGQRAGSTHPTGMHSSYSLIVSHLVETDICRIHKHQKTPFNKNAFQ